MKQVNFKQNLKREGIKNYFKIILRYKYVKMGMGEFVYV
jgi:hypothetical protein